MKMQQKLAVLLLLLGTLAHVFGGAAAAAVRLQMTHTDSGRGLTARELLHRMAQRSKARAARFLADAEGVPVTPGKSDRNGLPDTEYLAHFAIGTPAQHVQVTLDSGSDLIWTQCRPCATCFKQALPIFDPSLSSTAAGLECGSAACQELQSTSCSNSSAGNSTRSPCFYGYGYADGSLTFGRLVADTFEFDGGAAVPGVAFGCGRNNTGIFQSNETGIAGFGRGPLSLPSQLKADNFSYCFTAIRGSAPSHVLFGLSANDLYGSSALGTVQATPLIPNAANPSFYYLSLKGITVGSTRLPIPESTFALTANGTGGTIIDSGTGITSFPQDVYNLAHDAFIAQVSLPVVNATDTPLCFKSAPGSKPDVPKLVLHFDGATLDLPRENYMFEVQDAGAGYTCLALLPGTDMTVIGNYQQQNMHVLYDLANNGLSFVPAQCDKL